jgi:hypothetical protein
MKFLINKVDNKHLLILVHGLNGSELSWMGDKNRFYENLKQESIIKDNFNVAIYTYQTRIFQINFLTKFKNTILGFLRNRPNENIKGFNVGIDSISRNFEFEIRNINENYNTISIIAHSMGGLVTKSALTWLDSKITEKIPLFISLSVPHIGSFLAQLGEKLLGNNPQLIDLKAMGDFTTQLNQRFSNLTVRPKILYQFGNQDTVVPEQSAIPANVEINNTVRTQDDHFSVLLVKDRRSNPLFIKILNELRLTTQPFLAIDISIPAGSSFRDIVNILTAKLKIRVNFKGFSESELDTLLRETTISSYSIDELFNKLAKQSTSKFPQFVIEREKNTDNYILTKII